MVKQSTPLRTAGQAKKRSGGVVQTNPPQPGDDDKRARYDIPPEKFIEVWETSSTAEEAASRLNMPKPIVHARASQYRKAGVKLKSMPRPSKARLDVKGLNNLVAVIKSAKRGADEQGLSPEQTQSVVDEVLAKIHTANS
jgi:hypothetical protein